MLSAFYIALRLIHFTALMVLSGSAICCSLLAPQQFKPVLVRRLNAQWRPAVWLSMISACLLFMAQAGQMGDGWRDIISPDIWQVLLKTRFGSVWIWQLILSLATLVAVLIAPRATPGLLLLLAAAQLMLLAGVGHAAMRASAPGVFQRINHAIHLLSAAWWVGGLPPLLVCMQMARKPRWRIPAMTAMMRFSRYGHLAVAAVLVTGVVNSVLVLGWALPLESGYFRLLAMKVGLVLVMVTLALINRYILVPRFEAVQSDAQRKFIYLTWLEVILSVAVLLLVSIYATWEPF